MNPDACRAAASGAEQTYRIGAVARLTGIPADTLRVWERRYGVVKPRRTAAGTRLYAAADICRLSLLKRLVEHGDAIRHIASFDSEALRERLRGLGVPPDGFRQKPPCRVLVLGQSLSVPSGAWLASDAPLPAVHFVGQFQDERRFRAEAAALQPDLVVLEWPTLHADQVAAISDLWSTSAARCMLVVYQFANRLALQQLHAQRITTRRAPLDAGELGQWCATLHALAAPLPGLEALAPLDLAVQAPPRRFDAATLARIGSAMPSVRCECPRHLAQLVSSLIAFEAYSRECQHRDGDDAALHAYLHGAAAQARATLEAALARLIEAEGLAST